MNTTENTDNNEHISAITSDIKCNYCEKVLKSDQGLKRHIRIVHIGDRPFHCPKCGQDFKCTASLKNHLKYVHADANSIVWSKCPNCNKMVKNLTRHLLMHRELKHECPTCKKKFQMFSLLQNHIMNHTGEKPYYCQFCYKTFRQQGTMRSHENTVHLLKKIFKCELCSESFGQKNSLVRHVSGVHFKERPCKCTVCPKAFCRNSDLRKHMKTHHPADKERDSNVTQLDDIIVKLKKLYDLKECRVVLERMD